VKLSGRWDVVVTPPRRVTAASNTHIVNWCRPLSALCLVQVPDFRDVPVAERPFAAPATATCRRCRSIWRHMAETDLPAAVLEAARETDRLRRLGIPAGQLAIFEVPP